MPDTATGTGDPISDQFDKIWGMVSPSQSGGSGGTTDQNGIVKEPSEGNSLTKFLRSTFNLAGDQSAEDRGQGQANIGAGVSAMEQPFNYWSAILSGDPQALAKAIGPTVGAVDRQFEGARRSASELMPRGGFRSATLANLPFQEAGKISDSILSQQKDAATNVAQIGQFLSTLGLSQEQMSMSLLSMLTSGQLTVRGQDIQESAANKAMIGDIAKGIGAITGGFIAKSDRRLKENIKFIGIENGYPIYSFNYRVDPSKTYTGVMAHEIKVLNPAAVYEDEFGILSVDYAQLGLEMNPMLTVGR